MKPIKAVKILEAVSKLFGVALGPHKNDYGARLQGAVRRAELLLCSSAATRQTGPKNDSWGPNPKGRHLLSRISALLVAH